MGGALLIRGMAQGFYKYIGPKIRGDICVPVSGAHSFQMGFLRLCEIILDSNLFQMDT